MVIACIVLSSLALLAAGANFILFFAEKKRDVARRQAMLDYVNNQCESTIEENEEFVKDFVSTFFGEEFKQFEAETEKRFSYYGSSFDSIAERTMQQQIDIECLKSDIEKLKSGAVPNYEAALAAANAVNDFNAGISAIMNFDPIETARARRRGSEKEAS